MNKLTPEQHKGQDGTCEVVKVVADNEEGFAHINAHDFDEKSHKLFKKSAPAPAAAPDKK